MGKKSRQNSNNEKIKKEFAKVIKNAQITAFLFFLLLTPTIVLIIKEQTELFGVTKDIWFNASIAGFIIYIGYMFFLWKCPNCGKYPGRGWFRKECDNCGCELS